MKIEEINKQIAKIIGLKTLPFNRQGEVHIRYGSHQFRKFNPCQDWAEGGPLIEIHGVNLNFTNSTWRATIEIEDTNKPNAIATNPEALTAAMLAIIEYDRLMKIK